jgi:hypothetical protein
MRLAKIFSRIVKGSHDPDRLATLSQEISQARENMRLNAVAIDSGDRALRHMSGMMRLLMEADVGKTEK